MAKTTVTHVTDDLDGSADASEVAFSYAGVDYKVDLSKKNRAALDKAMAPYVNAATKVSKGQRGTTARGQRRTDLASVRRWAKEQGLDVSERGRVSAQILDAYDSAH